MRPRLVSRSCLLRDSDIGCANEGNGSRIRDATDAKSRKELRQTTLGNEPSTHSSEETSHFSSTCKALARLGSCWISKPWFAYLSSSTELRIELNKTGPG